MAYTMECVMCREELPLHELVTIDGALVCGDCLHDFCESEQVVKNHLADFLQENEKSFLTYWFSGDGPENFGFLSDNPWITEGEKLRILREAYQRWTPWHLKAARDMELDFMSNYSDRWENYLKGL